jgi:hypothetical protein
MAQVGAKRLRLSTAVESANQIVLREDDDVTGLDRFGADVGDPPGSLAGDSAPELALRWRTEFVVVPDARLRRHLFGRGLHDTLLFLLHVTIYHM